MLSFLKTVLNAEKKAAVLATAGFVVLLSGCDFLPFPDEPDSAVSSDSKAPRDFKNVSGISRLRSVSDPVEGRYLVQLMKHTRLEPMDEVLGRLVSRHNVDIDMTFRQVFYGFAAGMNRKQAEAIAADGDVVYVEQDNYLTIAESSAVDGASEGQPWGLAQLAPGAADYNPAYQGIGVNIYVLSTGVNPQTPELSGRVGRGLNAGINSPWLAELLGKQQPNALLQLLGRKAETSDENDTDDCHGHGTRMATIAAGSSIGAAPLANIRPLKAIGCDGRGTTSSVLQTMEWLRGRYQRPAVLLLPISGSRSKILDAALRTLTKKDIIPIVAAGDVGADACEVSPAGVRMAITVGGYDKSSAQLAGANGGNCIDFMLPGGAVDSVNARGERQLSTGSSAAAAYASGILAQLREAYGLEGRKKIQRRLADITSEKTVSVNGQPVVTKTFGSPQR